MAKKNNIYVGDFETTVYEGQEETAVWASALTKLFDDTEHVEVFNSLPATYEYILENIHSDCIIYYHNLKFDGEFWISYLMSRGDYKEAYNEKEGLVIYEGTFLQRTLQQGEFLPTKEMQTNTFKYLISDMGAWYTVVIKRPDGYVIELRDSLKLIPCSVKKMGKDFATKHRKTEIEYTGYRVAGGYISEQERDYIANDVLVVKEVLEIMYNEGHTKLTIGACCLSEYQRMVGNKPRGFSPYDEMFPKLDQVLINKEKYGDDNVDAYIRRSFHGGWCYVKEDIAGKLNGGKENGGGCTADVNSLYPSVMSGESGNRYPIGFPFMFDDLLTWNKVRQDDSKYYFVRVRTRFRLKEGFLPFIQIKRNKLYKSTEMLKTSDVKSLKDGKYYKFMKRDGELVPTTVAVTFSKTDWELVNRHYDLTETEFLDGVYFYTTKGLFDPYINKYKKIKMESKGAKRSIAKLFLNNLFGKMAAGTNSSFKHILPGADGELHSETIFECNKEAGYIAIGAAITSYARAFTVTAAQANYKFFAYADTDSLHCFCRPEQLVGVPVHDTEFLHWKIESEWDEGLFVRQKTYAEHIVKEDGEKVEKPYWNIKCAGLPDKCKKMLAISVNGLDNYSEDDIIKMKKELKLTERELKFIETKRTIEDFKEGLVIPGKLLPVHIKGGIVLADVDFTLH